MEKATRAELIRARYLAKARGLAYVPSGKPIQVAHAKPVVDRLVIGWPQIIPDTKRAPQWMKDRDARPLPAPAPDRRRKGAPALERIADRWGERKLLAAPMLRR